MYRIGDTVRVKNGCDTRQYHNWSVGTEAVVQFVRNDNLDLRISPPRGGAMTTQTLYERDVEFVSRSSYESGDEIVVIGCSEVTHYIPLGVTATVMGYPYTPMDGITKIEVQSPVGMQTVSVKDVVPYSFWFEMQYPFVFSEMSPPITTGDLEEATSSYAIAVPNNVVTVHSITDRPKCDDENLFTEFTSWLHPFIGGARSVEEGLVIDACTVITFLGKTDEDDLFSIRYEDTGNIVIAKGKLNNGYAKYRV